MTHFLSKALGFALTLSLASTAAAVRLDSSGENDEYIGVANFAFSYSSEPLYLYASCYIDSDDSSWDAPSTCSSNGETCWAAYTDNSGYQGTSAFMILGSMRKALLHYYAKDHKSDSQGLCNLTVGTSLFQVSFEFQDTGVDFSLALNPLEGGPEWTSGNGEACPYQIGATTGPLMQVFYANSDVSNSSNLICNEDLIVSLSADPEVSDAAMLSVINNPYGLLSGVQEAPATGTTTRESNSAGRRRLADRPTDEGRWLVTGDSAGDLFHGVLMSENETDQEVEFVACQGSGGGSGKEAALADYAYTCDFVSEDGTNTRTQSLSLPGDQLRPRPLSGPAPGPRNGPAETRLAAGVLKRIHALAPLGRVASPGEDDASPTLWQGGGADQRIVMVQDRSAELLEIVSHRVDVMSPGFVSCTERTEDPRNLGYVCRSATRCVGAPCSPEAWSAGRSMEFPKALFKDRPCRPDEGGEVKKARLKLSRLGKSKSTPKLRFRSTVDFEEGTEISPQSNGFRFLVEDASGKTVVDVDVPAPGKDVAPAKKKGWTQGWKVRKGGRDLRYQTGDSSGGAVPRVSIRKRGKGANRWEIDVKGYRGLFGEDDLALPLTASLSLDTNDPNSQVCAVVPFLDESKEGPDADSSAKPACKEKSKGRSIDCRQKRR